MPARRSDSGGDDDRRRSASDGDDDQFAGSRRVATMTSERAVALIDTSAIAENVRVLRRLSGTPLMAVVKADGYGHGALAAARAALAGGADQLGVAFPAEAVALRAQGITGPLLAWLWAPAEDVTAAAAAGVMLGVSSLAQLDRLRASRVGGVGVHLKVDTGLGRGGSAIADWAVLCRQVAAAEAAGDLRVVGVMSHLANSEVLGDPTIAEQRARLVAAVGAARDAGLDPETVHLANTAAAIGSPDTRFDLVRCGIGIYGLDPLDLTGARTAHGLRPAMTLCAQVALTKRVAAGQGVSYGLTYRTTTETTLALIPVGYGDGIPRAGSSRATVWVNGKQHRIVGRVAMDQVVIDVGDEVVMAGDQVILFGDGRRGEPTAADWATACDTIDYEIVTRISPRVPRRLVGDSLPTQFPPAESLPAESLPAESLPAESLPAESLPPGSTPAEFPPRDPSPSDLRPNRDARPHRAASELRPDESAG